MIRFRPLLGPTLWTLPALLLLIGLGVWQVERLQWKLALIDAVSARTHAAPIPLGQAMGMRPAQAEWRNVRVEGHFLPGKEAYVFALDPNGQPGVRVIAPLVDDSGAVVLIDRGFVPDALRRYAGGGMGQPKGRVRITGILRLSQEPGLFSPAPDTKSRLVFVKNVPAIASILQVRPRAPILVEADATPNPGGFPLGGQTLVDIPNNHIAYAITWFGLALALLAVYLVYHHRQGRLRFE